MIEFLMSGSTNEDRNFSLTRLHESLGVINRDARHGGAVAPLVVVMCWLGVHALGAPC